MPWSLKRYHESRELHFLTFSCYRRQPFLVPEVRDLWQRRYYDFNVFRDRKRLEKLNYMHQNPVERGLVHSPDQWRWSSFRHYMTGETGTVEIESQWTARRRERDGIVPVLRYRAPDMM